MIKKRKETISTRVKDTACTEKSEAFLNVPLSAVHMLSPYPVEGYESYA